MRVIVGLVFCISLAAQGLVPNPIGTPIFNGSGLNDMSAAGQFVGTANVTYMVTIATTVTQFNWSATDGGSGTGIAITGGTCAAPYSTANGWQVLSHGVAVCWLASTGHTAGNNWTVVVTANGTVAPSSTIFQGIGAKVLSQQSINRGTVLSSGYDTFTHACAATQGIALNVDVKWTALLTQTCLPALNFTGGMLQPASGQTLTVTLQAAPDAQIFDVSMGGHIVVSAPGNRVNPKWWGAVPDSVTDNTGALQDSIASACATGAQWTLPPVAQGYSYTDSSGYTHPQYSNFFLTHTLTVNCSLNMTSAALAQGISGNATGVLADPTYNEDILDIYGANGGLNVTRLSFLHDAGNALGVSSATSTAVTPISPSNITLATLNAKVLAYGYTVYTWQTYTTGGYLYRVTAITGTGQIPAMGSGGILPSGTVTGVSETHNGITYLCEGTGTTYQQGQINSSTGTVWWFHGFSGGNLTDVTPQQGGTGVPNNYDGMGSSIVGSGIYFDSLWYQGNTGSNTSAFVHIETGSTYQIDHDYGLFCPGYCFYAESAAVNPFFHDNVEDGGWVGFGGNLTEAQIGPNNEFFGSVGPAISSNAGQFFHIFGNLFVGGTGINFSTAYVPGMTADSPVSYGLIDGNVFQNISTAFYANGVTALRFAANNVIARSEIGFVMSLANTDRSQFGGQFTGAGESANAVGSQYYYLSGVLQNNLFDGNSFQQISAAELVTTLFDWSAAPTQEQLNVVTQNNYCLPGIYPGVGAGAAFSVCPYTWSTGSATNSNTSRNRFTSPAGGPGNYVVIGTLGTAADLIPGDSPQVINYAGTLSGDVAITLARTGALDGDFFVLNLGINFAGHSLNIMAEADGTPIDSYTASGVVNYQLCYTFSQSYANWVPCVPNTFGIAGAGITSLTGPVTATGPGSAAATITPTGVTPGTYGATRQAPIVAVNAAGQITSASTSGFTAAQDGADVSTQTTGVTVTTTCTSTATVITLITTTCTSTVTDPGHTHAQN